MDWFETNYLGRERAHIRDPRASPLLAEDLSGLAPAYVVTAAFDPLRDEGEEYAEALRAAGTTVLLRRFPGFIHAFIAGAGVSRNARDALVEIAGVTRGMFGAAAAPATGARPSGRVPLSRPGAGLGRLGLAVLGRRGGLQVGQQMQRGVGDLVDRARERLLVGARGLGEAADLPHVLKGGRSDLVLGGGRIEVVESSDVSAHAS